MTDIHKHEAASVRLAVGISFSTTARACWIVFFLQRPDNIQSSLRKSLAEVIGFGLRAYLELAVRQRSLRASRR